MSKFFSAKFLLPGLDDASGFVLFLLGEVLKPRDGGDLLSPWFDGYHGAQGLHLAIRRTKVIPGGAELLDPTRSPCVSSTPVHLYSGMGTQRRLT